ncbi:hypothetical protein TBLA_0E03280 [Henningerozyma blattae CBS 6284]|uniref:BZIP domain-containing protein n=1 Tax=Henningerozyma blattae (strain ATCC 34711 / CBS 6284 / DSM 70876 / NBRC 10599 / NRRL Y-10934 / UCD 77-7) TaxID=1071380 RepID=I2H4T0_HENB6|nr:hypothetical protein TBLA_0E03280 [Tetrapisispora blattae CBS 6284]CCH61382.1 hypothetical protein TBLA_0E03280 [Tetrapisispora blattae CBS 6284]
MMSGNTTNNLNPANNQNLNMNTIHSLNNNMRITSRDYLNNNNNNNVVRLNSNIPTPSPRVVNQASLRRYATLPINYLLNNDPIPNTSTNNLNYFPDSKNNTSMNSYSTNASNNTGNLKLSHSNIAIQSVKTDQELKEEYINEKGQLIGKSGKPLRNTKRAAQNRSSQKHFRERRGKYIKQLEEKVEILNEIRLENNLLKLENLKLKQLLKSSSPSEEDEDINTTIKS